MAKKTDISETKLLKTALANFIKNPQDETHIQKNSPSKEIQSELNEQETCPGLDRQKPNQKPGEKKEIHQGDIYWVRLPVQNGEDPGYSHPHVVIQNHSHTNSVVVCAITSNKKQANLPGNILLEIGEANLSRQSIVVVSRISTVDKTQLGEYIGTLTQDRINQILAGLKFLHLSFFDR
ncbi:MAG: PemK family transcriptional regulator [Anaerolineaceae bacterium]|nr:PemK family transcriptional regulator [Anaerolineaceae bacterium]